MEDYKAVNNEVGAESISARNLRFCVLIGRILNPPLLLSFITNLI